MMAVLTLQYPDSYEGRLIVIASTYNRTALRVFKKVCLEEAQLKAIGFAEDEVLLRDAQHEYKRLLDLLNLLIPEGDPEDDHGDG
jgi:hypothetical protein